MASSFKSGTRLSKFMTIFGYFMVLVYLGLGALLFFSDTYSYIPKNIRFAFALFFIAYGVYRFVKMWNKDKEDEQ